MSQPTRYRLDVQGKNYLVAMVADKDGEYIDYRNYASLQAENKRLRKAGDAFLGTYLFASVKGLVTQDEALKVVEEWHAAKERQS